MNPLSSLTKSRAQFFAVFALFILGFVFAQSASAQLNINVAFKRSLYLKNEPIIATVTIENQTGRELYLADSNGKPWFGFQIASTEGRLVPPRDPNYALPPVQIGPGQTLTRQWNITPLYAISEYGAYRIQAHVLMGDTSNYVSSLPKVINITEGRLLWQQTAGVPNDQEGAGSKRVISLISLRLSRSTVLYLRVEDPMAGITYATHRLGNFVSFGIPNVQLDSHNYIHVLQNTSPKVFLYTKVDLNGKILERKVYEEAKNPPSLQKQGDNIAVVGGTLQVAPAEEKPGVPTQKTHSLSERPALPKD
ncbi:MAG: hypothetical protein ABI615_01865 [Chthoniobacterales bacterium]